MNKKEKILSIIKIIYICSMLIVLITLPLALFVKPLIYVSLSFIVILIGLYLTIHIIRSKIYEYRCPICNHAFQISFVKDITSYNSGIGSKVLVCPSCKKKDIMKQNLK